MAEESIVKEEDDGQRLDRWLKKNFPGLPFGQLQKMLRTGQVRVDGKRAKGEARLATGQAVRIPPLLAMPASERPAAPKKPGISEKDETFIRSLVIYQDDYLIAINKPSGLATQGGTKVVKHIDGLLPGLARDDVKPHLIHRLDRDTSGVLLLARTPKMAKEMGELFRGRDIRKYYWAVTSPSPQLAQGRIQSSLAKVAGSGGERMMAVNDDEGKNAITLYSVMESVGHQVAWVAFWPRTGRTHQIRVHAAQMGCPLLGDYKYGFEQPVLEEIPELPHALHLHARRIIFRHPVTGKKVDISAPLSNEMRKTFKYFGFSPDDKSDPFEDVEA